jgi:hypothetical protein
MLLRHTKSVVPRVTFGMIVLNGEPFLRYNLRTLYPFAHQIIVVEGAASAGASVATPDGHSIDDTLNTLRDFKEHEDPDNKLIIVTAESEEHPNGFWPGEKHEQSQAYARRATGDYLWQVDVDEFYQPHDLQAVLKLLCHNPGITAVSFKMIVFWGGFDYITDGWYLRRGAATYHRLFKWAAGYQYTTHRPPTVVDTAGRNLRDINWISGDRLARQGILLYHYSLLLPKQVVDKCRYYGQAAWARRYKVEHWATENYLLLRNPYRVHIVYEQPSWLERFTGSHPPQIEQMREAISSGRIPITMRPTADIEWLLASRRYQIGRLYLQALDYVERLQKIMTP